MSHESPPYQDGLPSTGYLRQRHLVAKSREAIPKVLLPFSPSTLWRMVRAGAFPAPVKLSQGVTAWRVEDVRAWLEASHKKSAWRCGRKHPHMPTARQAPGQSHCSSSI